MRTIIAALGACALASVAGPVFAADAPADIAHGKQAFQYWCAPCHAAAPQEGRLLPGSQSLQVKYKGSKPAALEERDDLVAPITVYVIRHGQDGMPFFRKTEISDKDVNDIAAYLARNVK